jgi:hypothetical protein
LLKNTGSGVIKEIVPLYLHLHPIMLDRIRMGWYT